MVSATPPLPLVHEPGAWLCSRAPPMNQPSLVLGPKTTDVTHKSSGLQGRGSRSRGQGTAAPGIRVRAGRAGPPPTEGGFPRTCWHFWEVRMGKMQAGKTMNPFSLSFVCFPIFALLHVEMDSTWVAWNNKMNNGGWGTLLTRTEYINIHTHQKISSKLLPRLGSENL